MNNDIAGYLIISSISIGGTLLSHYLVTLEDKRYDLSKKMKVLNYISVIIINLLVAINLQMIIGPILLLRCMMTSLLFTSLMIDFKLMELPDTLTFVSVIPAICLFDYNIKIESLWCTLSVMALSCVIMIALTVLGGLGFGDVKLILPILLTIPVSYALAYWLIAILVAAIVSIFLYLFRKVKKISFGPYLIISMIGIYIMNIF